MLSHTPGPWRMVTVSTSVGFCHRIFPAAWGDKAPSHGGICAYDDSTSLNPHTVGEQAANARLIAAAPDLLAALIGWRNANTPETYDAAIEAANAAITKATTGATL